MIYLRFIMMGFERAIVGGTPEFPGQLIALLLVAHWCHVVALGLGWPDLGSRNWFGKKT